MVSFLQIIVSKSFENHFKKGDLKLREIKFRQWDSETKKMSEVEVINFSKGQTLRDKPKILMQYTELKDIENNKIYDGDILQTTDGYGCLYKVYFSDGAFRTENSDDGLLEYVADICLVIGNIYENPELMEVTND